MASRRLLTHTLRHDRLTRSSLLYVPRHMLHRGALPLVVMFHGGASQPEALAQMSAMHKIAERDGFIVAYPAGLPGRSGLNWSPGGKGAARVTRDASFADELIRDLRHAYNIDPTRIFAAGFSVGGSLVYELASLLADRLAAVAVVAGAMITFDLPAPTRPVSLIHIHGTKDRRVPFEGGRGPATSESNVWPPVRAGIERWCAINGCAAAPGVVSLGLEGVTGYQYVGAGDVDLWVVEGGGHSWPGAQREAAPGEDRAPAARGFSASETIWQFFAAHQRGRRRPPRGPMGPTRRDTAP